MAPTQGEIEGLRSCSRCYQDWQTCSRDMCTVNDTDFKKGRLEVKISISKWCTETYKIFLMVQH